MLELAVWYALQATPYIMIFVGLFGAFLLLARTTVNFVSPRRQQ